jgi:hypothetical protein
MKHLIYLLLVLITLFYIHHVEAEEYLVMKYNENVRIVLSNEKCPTEGFRAVAQRIDKQIMKACWSYNNKMINIKWEGGDFSEFPVDRFYPVEIK